MHESKCVTQMLRYVLYNQILIMKLFGCLLLIAAVSNCSAQTVITRLPKDGCWARYEMVSIQHLTLTPDGEYQVANPLVFKGEMTIRLVGQRQIDMQAYRWMEMETKMKRMPSDVEIEGDSNQELIQIVKALVPEEELRQGKPFQDNVKKLYVLNGILGEAKIEELDPNSTRGKQFAAALMAPQGAQSKPLPGKEIESGVGKLKCTGTNYNKTKDMGNPGEEKVKDDNPFPKQLHYSHDMYFNESTPFGLVKVHGTIQRIEKNKKLPFVETELTLKATGTDAKSAIDHEKLSDKTPLR